MITQLEATVFSLRWKPHDTLEALEIDLYFTVSKTVNSDAADMCNSSPKRLNEGINITAVVLWRYIIQHLTELRDDVDLKYLVITSQSPENNIC